MKDREIIAIAGGALILLFLLGSFGMGFGMMGLGMGFGAIIWILLLLLLVYFLAGTGKTESVGGGEDSAIRILNERYAKGEIGREEYLEKKKELT